MIKPNRKELALIKRFYKDLVARGERAKVSLQRIEENPEIAFAITRIEVEIQRMMIKAWEETLPEKALPRLRKPWPPKDAKSLKDLMDTCR